MNKNVKKPLLLWSVIVVGLGLSAAFAQIHVKSDLSNAIQNIQKVYFSPEGIQDPDPAKNILVEMDGGVLRIHGKVLAETANAKNTLSSWATNALLIQGRDNKVFWKDSTLVWGEENRFFENSESDTILWGKKNIAFGWSQNWVIFAGRNNTIQTWSNSAIAAGERNEIEGTNSFVAGGSLVAIKGDNSFAAGANIKQADTPKNSVFLWSDNSLNWATQFLKPAQDDTFLIRAANGLAIWKNRPEVKGVDVKGFVQIWDQELVCSEKTKGAIKYVGDMKGCFCSCNGEGWMAMSQSKNCMQRCK